MSCCESAGMKFICCVTVIFTLMIASGCSAEVKKPAVAGAFYPGERQALLKVVENYLAAGKKREVPGQLIALVAPHAGYQFSGPVAGHTYAQLKGSGIDTVVLIGPSHHAPLRGASIYAAGSFETPLGKVPVNESAARSLLDEKAGITFDRGPFAREHSLEVQLPFLQRVLPNASIVPVLVGNPSQEAFDALTYRLTQLLRGNRKALLLVSSDLSHYHNRGKASGMDNGVIDAVERLSVRDLETLLAKGTGEACGGYPLLISLAVSRNLGATSGMLYRYADSGDASGDTRKVVGYAAMGIYRSPLTDEERKELVKLARRSLDSHVNRTPFAETPPSTARMKADGATFVTLNDRMGRLRGCIGTILPVMPLARSVVMNARSAASNDPRFPPVRPEELPGIHLEVTVLSPLEQIPDISRVKIGTHGLYLEKGGRSSVFLPQVPVEQGWDLPTYLEELALKAGLPRDGWKGARLSTFTAEIIKEQ